MNEFGNNDRPPKTDWERAQEIIKLKPGDQLPPDIAGIWGNNHPDSSGRLAEETAQIMIAAWGVDEFRQSKLHQRATMEFERHSALKERRQSYFKNKKQK